MEILCRDLYMDGTPSMVGSLKGFVSFAKQENHNVITSFFFFLHPVVLIVRTTGHDLKTVLDQGLKMVNVFKS